MDRRQRKTREAIFTAFNELLTKREYHKISVQDIIDAADIGRSTFYSHFDTKDELLKEMCTSLLDHVFSGVPNPDIKCSHDLSLLGANSSTAIITHLLAHLRDNRRNILDILACSSDYSNEIILQLFKQYLNDLLPKYTAIKPQEGIPKVFIVNHISGSFINMVQWWVNGGLKESPEELTTYFEAMICPLLQSDTASS